MSDAEIPEAAAGEVNTCAGCAIALEHDQQRCLAHVDQDRRDRLIKAWAVREMPLSLRGVSVNHELLNQILDAAPVGDDGIRQLHSLYCTGATFSSDVRLEGATFAAHADFDRATFCGDVRFEGITFHGEARFFGATFSGLVVFKDATFGLTAFDGATFSGDVDFSGARFSQVQFHQATFSGLVAFQDATFSGYVGFDGATFKHRAFFLSARFGDHARFIQATFIDDVGFSRATFGNSASFAEATFGGHSWFTDATFGDGASFDGATFNADAWFDLATFGDGARLGPMAVTGALRMRGTTMRNTVVVAAANILDASRLHPSGACQLRIGGRDSSPGELDLTHADCSSPTIVAPVTDDDLRTMKLDTAGSNRGMRLVSVGGADVAELTCTDVDFSVCHFAGAHHLDALHIDGTSRFATPPNHQLWPPTQWRWWSPRRVLAEEAVYRANERKANGRARWSGWHSPDRAFDDSGEPVTAARLVGLYRALRKSRDDAKDEPGAADFYYGEMEMRRLDPERPRAERWILVTYWMLAGYGLRASRAFIALAAVLTAATLVLWNVGFVDATPIVDVLLYAIGVTTSIGGVDPPHTLTTAGQATRLGLRLTGPLLIGFALLALRGRVKR